jgi:hypothetical protein
LVLTLRPFLTLREAEELLYRDDRPAESDSSTTNSPQFHANLVFSISALEAIAWVVAGTANTILSANDPISWETLAPFAIALSWIYSTFVLALHPKSTPSYDVLILSVVNLAGSVVSIGGALFDWQAYGAPLPPQPTRWFMTLDLMLTFILVVLILRMPLAIPSKNVDASRIVSVPV